jgi:hypothetical protein
MNRLNRFLVLGVLAASLVAGRAFADDANKGSNTTGQPVAPSDKPSSVQTCQCAGQLAAWARSNHDPIGLAMAARIISLDPPRTMDNPNKQASAGNTPSDQAKPAAMDMSPTALIAEAKQMAGDDKDTQAAIADIEKTIPESRGHPGGAILDKDVLPPGGSVTYTISFTGGEPMEIAVFADQPGMVDWHVYDENGNEIQSEAGDHFVNMPKWTGPFHVVLNNATGGYVPYSFATN